ncbi:PTS fructose transporter subunit IIC [Brevundimonas sp. TSRC1-1]|uniref:PTS fructose transporter subunit IIC n=1 Tax=Brevundimonas sp. TSRC1-1 TaxID=2804562 RepID=UPI003CEDC2C1
MLLAIIVGDMQRTTQALLASEALRRAAARRGLTPPIEVQVEGAVLGALEVDAKPDLLLLVGDPEPRPVGSEPVRTLATLEAVLTDADAVLARVIDGAGAPALAAGLRRIVAITSCPTGIAHTFMAAEGLKAGADSLGYAIRVETQGSVGARDGLTQQEIDAADVVVIAADTQVDLSRFAGKRVLVTGTKPAINDGAALIERALAEARSHDEALTPPPGSTPAKAPGGAGVYKHLMTGVSFMLPFVVAGGLLIALAFAVGGIYAGDQQGTFAAALFQIGAKAAFTLMVPALAGYVAFSIADRPGLAPGMIGGVLAAQLGAGFLGGILAGFIAGYAVRLMSRWIRLPQGLEGLKPVLLLPLLGTLITGLAMIYIVGRPTALVLTGLSAWLQSLQGGGASTLGALLGGMMAIDMGGPINKAAYAFSTGLLTSDVYGPMAAVMAGGMTPPLGLFLGTRLFPQRFTPAERAAGPATALLGLAFITEGALPFAARDPLRVIPALVLGAATAGALSMAVGAQLRAPHGGLFVMLIPNAVSHVLAYGLAVAAGSAITAVALRGLLPRQAA